MTVTTYLYDTCIWRDHYENRFGPRGRPLGDHATKLFMRAIAKKWKILYSELTVYELKLAYGEEEIEEMLGILYAMGILKFAEITKQDHEEAKRLSLERNVSKSDVLHAILAQKYNAIVVTQNIKDFEKLADIAVPKRPEELL